MRGHDQPFVAVLCRLIWRPRVWAFSLLLLLSATGTTAVGGVSPAGKLSVEETIGFRETIKIGKWLPVTVTIRNDGAPVRGQLALQLSTVSEGYPRPYMTTLSQPVDLPTSSRKRYTFVVMFRDFTHPLVIRLLDRVGTLLYSREIDLRSLTSPDRLIVAFSDEPVLDSLAAVAPGKARVVYPTLEELPGRWEALDAVDMIAIRNLPLTTLRPEQLQAIQQWIARGGRLLVAGGPNWTHYTHPAMRALAAVKVTGLVEISSIQALEPMAGVSSPQAIQIGILRAEVAEGEILAEEGDLPLVVAQRRGRGVIIFVTFDPGRVPFSSWEGTAPLWRGLFRLDEVPNYWKLRRELRETFDETWIAQALQLPLLSFPSHLLVALFLILYASTIGFCFWRLGLERISRRETWTLIICSLAAFSGGAHLLFREQHIQQDALLFEVSAVDVIPQSRFAEIETHVAILSLRKQAYDLKLAGQPSAWLQIVPPMARDLQLDWHLSADGGLTIKEVFVPSWGVRVFKGRGMSDFPLESRVLQEADDVMVRITNRTGFVLRHCWLWRGPRIVPLGTLEDGELAEGVISVTPEEMMRGSQQARWDRDLAHEMFKGREAADLLRRAIVERTLQEALRGGVAWRRQVMFIGWLEQPLVALSVTPGEVGTHRTTVVRMRLEL
jgi:hypothetical protein